VLLVSCSPHVCTKALLTCSSGDMLNPKKKYNLDYYLSVVEKIVGMGAHILGIKVC
jgi:pyruvate carboxylase